MFFLITSDKRLGPPQVQAKLNSEQTVRSFSSACRILTVVNSVPPRRLFHYSSTLRRLNTLNTTHVNKACRYGMSKYLFDCTVKISHFHPLVTVILS